MENWKSFDDERKFDEKHYEICENHEWIQQSNNPQTIECRSCGSYYIPEQEYFSPDSNPQFNDEGKQVCSGAYIKVEFIGYIRA